MRDNEKHPARDRRAFPEHSSAHHNEHHNSTANDAPAFVRRAWQRWNVAIDEALAVELKPWPLAESAAAAIWREWHTDEGRPE